MDVVGIDDFQQGASNVPFLGDARLVKGDLTNATFLHNVFNKFRFDVVYHLPDQPSVTTGFEPSSQLYTSTLVRSAANQSQNRRPMHL
jgi:GDP-D-mannose dehydratase